MEQRTCPFCGGVQSESRCEICGRPTLRINPKASDKRKNQHPYAENPRTNVREENPYLASIRKKKQQQEQNRIKSRQMKQQDQAVRMASIISITVFCFIAGLLFLIMIGE